MTTSRIIRAAGAGVLLGLGSFGASLTALAMPAGAETSVAATFRCSAVDVSSSRHDLSNVVLRFDTGDQKFEGLKGTSATFSGTGSFTGAVVRTVFIKAGNNLSGEGPGYGERIDASGDTCGRPASTPSPSDEGNTTSGGNGSGNGGGNAGGNGGGNAGGGKGSDDGERTSGPARDQEVASSNGGTATVGATFDCSNTSVVVTSTKDLSNVVLRLSDGRDVKHDGLTGMSKSFTAPAGTTIVAVFVKSGANASGEGPGYGEKVNAPAASCDTTPGTQTGGDTSNNTPPNNTTNTPGGNNGTNPKVDVTDVLADTEHATNIGTAVSSVRGVQPRPAEVLGVTLVAERPRSTGDAASVRPAEVLGMTLARTGVDLFGLMLAGASLLTAGTVMVRRSKRPAVS